MPISLRGQPVDVRYSLNQARLTMLGVAILDPDVDVLDAGHLIRGVLRLLQIMRTGAGKENNFPGSGQCVQVLQRDQIDRISVFHDEFETVRAVHQAFSRKPALVARSPRLVVGAHNRRETYKKANDIRVRRKPGE